MEIDSQVYDSRKFMIDNTRLISTTKNMFVVYLDGRRLYVLSVAPQGWVVWAANHFSDLHAFTFHKLINNYFRYPHVGLRYFEPLPIAASSVGENRLLEHNKPPLITNMKIQTFQVLPDDYNNWSSTVILFQDNDADETHVYALNSDDCLVYYVLSYQRRYVCPRGVGYTAGDFKIYFVGNAIFDEDLDDGPGPQVSLHVDVYDIRTRRWITDDFPLMNSPKPNPFVFFLGGRLFVLSTQCSRYLDEAPFEMLDINNLSQGWISLPEPSFAWNYTVVGSGHVRMIDYPEKMLYIRLCDDDLLCGYNLHDDRWHELDPCRGLTLTGRMDNLFYSGRGCSDDSVIVEKYLYTFDVLEYPDGRRATLTITDLEPDTHPLSWQIDISSIVAPDVLRDLDAYGFLVYLGKSNSRQRFSLIISYCESRYIDYDHHLCTCTFDVRRIGENSTVSFLFDAICCCHYQHVKINQPVLDCHKLSEVKE